MGGGDLLSSVLRVGQTMKCLSLDDGDGAVRTALASNTHDEERNEATFSGNKEGKPLPFVGTVSGVTGIHDDRVHVTDSTKHMHGKSGLVNLANSREDSPP